MTLVEYYLATSRTLQRGWLKYPELETLLRPMADLYLTDDWTSITVKLPEFSDDALRWALLLFTENRAFLSEVDDDHPDLDDYVPMGVAIKSINDALKQRRTISNCIWSHLNLQQVEVHSH